MAKRRGRRSKRGTGRSTSILTALFAVTPALFIFTNTPAGSSGSPLSLVLNSANSPLALGAAAWALASNVIQNWVTILILLAIAFVGIKVVRKLGSGARITKHLRA